MRAASWRSSGRAAVFALVLGGLAAAGCYRTAALASLDPAPDKRIVAELTAVGSEEMAGWIGEAAVGIEADVIRWGEAEAELALLRVHHRGSRSVQWNREHVLFSVAALRNVRERTLDTRRTATFVGGLTTAATILAVMFIRSVAVGDGDNGGGTDPPH